MKVHAKACPTLPLFHASMRGANYQIFVKNKERKVVKVNKLQLGWFKSR